MTDIFVPEPSVDDIVALIEEAVRNPERAEEIKIGLRRKMSRPSGLARAASASADEATGEPEDLWDNVPI